MQGNRSSAQLSEVPGGRRTVQVGHAGNRCSGEVHRHGTPYLYAVSPIMTKEQILFYTSDWKGERFPDGRPKIPDDLLKRALH